jgi:poly(A) polymerase
MSPSRTFPIVQAGSRGDTLSLVAHPIAMPRLHSPEYRAALAIAQRLRELGYAAYFAGGCVRDLLLGRTPQDFDIATSATPDMVQSAFPRTEAVGAHFGVILVIDEVDGRRVATEVATFRSDGAYSDGRRPDAVRFSTDPAEDVQRRDFTINGLLLDPIAFERGAPLPDCIFDVVGGQEDLKAGIIRAIGEPSLRFAEDKLRMLRAVRFAARLGFTIEPQTFKAIQEQAASIHQVSCERTRDELTKILIEGAARRGFELLDETGLLVQVLPEVARLKGVEQPPQFHPEGDVWMHTLMLLEHLPAGASTTLAWGMLLHDIGKPATFTLPDPKRPGDRIRFNGHVDVGVAIARSILNRLRFSNEECTQILALIKHHMQFGDVQRMKQSTLKRFLRLPRFDEHLALHYADVMSSHGMLGAYEYAKESYGRLGDDEIKPRLLVTGEDLIRMGYKPGPRFREMLTAAEDAQLEGAVTTREAALSFVRERFGEPELEQVRS